MMRLRPLAVVLLCAASSAAGASQQEHLKPFGWLATLTGSCWVGSLPDGKVSDTQCYAVELDRFIKGTIVIGDADPRINKPTGFQGSAIFAWNAKDSRIDYWQWASDGSYRQQEAFLSGDLIVFPMPRKTPDAPQERTVWSRIDAASFRVVRERQDGTAWKQILTVTYRRRES
jgi:hypothetical protein